MKEPTNLMRKTATLLFPESPEEQESFLHALLEPQPGRSAVIRTGPARSLTSLEIDRAAAPEWLPEQVALLAPGEKPGHSEAYRNGEIYPLDFSSVITGSALLALSGHETEQWKVLDLCAAPGGKSILASRLLQPSLLFSNEVEGKRLGILRHNLSRCRVPGVYTQRLRPEAWAGQAPFAFDLCLVDAPCSGQSLLAKGKDNPGCFHPSIVKGNARRQGKIIAAASRTVAPGGYLFYSTCTFAKRENEEVIRKLLRAEPAFSPVPVPHLEEFRSPLSEFPAYRIYPHTSPGAGGFVALLRRGPEGTRGAIPETLFGYPVD